MMIVSKWKCEICEKEFDNFHAQGFDNKIYCPLCFFKEKTNRLEKENARLKDKLIEIKKVIDGYMPNEHAMCKAFDEIEFIIKEN